MPGVPPSDPELERTVRLHCGPTLGQRLMDVLARLQERIEGDGVRVDHIRPDMEDAVAEIERLRVAYDRLWHRASAHQDGDLITRLLPSPHQLRTGEKPSDLLDRITRTGTLDRG